MECNKDEATRAKEIAEKKFEAKDYIGSQKFALKSHSLYPGLAGIQHMLSTLKVYISSEDRVNGEIDWYKVLDVNPKADEETIKKQYRKQALVLHPDKNKSIGADGAFKLISEAWNLLSDKIQRSVYDQKRNIETVIKPKIPKPNPKPEAQKRKPPTMKKTTSSTTSRNPSNGQSFPSTITFWTVCHQCRLQHQYSRMFLRRNLLCSSCNLPYYAYEYPPPISQTRTKWHDFVKKNTGVPGKFRGSQPSNPKSFRPSVQMGFGWDQFSQMAGSSFANQATTAAQFASERSKEKREDTLEAMRRDREAELERNVGSRLDSNAAKRKKVDGDWMRTKSVGAETNCFEPKKRGRPKTKITMTEKENPNASKTSISGDDAEIIIIE